MENNLKNWLADTLIEEQAKEKSLERTYREQVSKNSILKCLQELLDIQESDKKDIKKNWIQGNKVLIKDVKELIDLLNDYECIKDLHEISGFDNYYIVLLEDDNLLIIRSSKYYNIINFRIMKVQDSTIFKQYSEHNFALKGLNAITISISFNDVNSHIDLLDKSIRELLVPISIEDIISRYKAKQESKKIERVLTLTSCNKENI